MVDEGGVGGGGGGRSFAPVVVSASVTLLLCALQLMGVLRPRSNAQIIGREGSPPPRLMEALRRTADALCRGCAWVCAIIVALCLGSGYFVVLLGLSGAFAVWELRDLMKQTAVVEPGSDATGGGRQRWTKMVADQAQLSIPTLACCFTTIAMPSSALPTNKAVMKIPEESEVTRGALPKNEVEVEILEPESEVTRGPPQSDVGMPRSAEIPEESEATQGTLPLFVSPQDRLEQLSIPMEVFSPQFISAKTEEYMWSDSADAVWHPVGTQGKAALLLLGFFPNHHQLDYLRHKSNMEMVIVAVQGVGLLTSVVTRLLQRLPPSPLELIAAMSSVALVLLPILQICFGCFLFRRDLVIHLNESQAKRWLQTRQSLTSTSRSRHTIQNRAKACGLALAAAAAFSLFVMYVYTHYWAAQPSSGRSCAACFPVALLIIISIALHLTEALVRILRYKIHTQHLASFFLFFVASVIHICSVVLAIKATTKDWRRLFEKPHKSLFQWIIPHV